MEYAYRYERLSTDQACAFRNIISNAHARSVPRRAHSYVYYFSDPQQVSGRLAAVHPVGEQCEGGAPLRPRVLGRARQAPAPGARDEVHCQHARKRGRVV